MAWVKDDRPRKRAMIAIIGTNLRIALFQSLYSGLPSRSRPWPGRHWPRGTEGGADRRARRCRALQNKAGWSRSPVVGTDIGPAVHCRARGHSFRLRSASPINRGNRRNCQAHGPASGCGTPRPGAREALRDPLGLAAEGCGQSLHSCILPGLRHSRTQRGWAKSGWPFRPPFMCLANNPSLIQHNLGFYHSLRCCDRRKCSCNCSDLRGSECLTAANWWVHPYC